MYHYALQRNLLRILQGSFCNLSFTKPLKREKIMDKFILTSFMRAPVINPIHAGFNSKVMLKGTK